MATVDLDIQCGVSPYSISVKKYGDGVERFVSYSGGVLTFNAQEGTTPVTYIVNISDNNGSSTTTGFNLQCPYNCGTPAIISNVDYECDTFAASLSFTVQIAYPSIVGIGNNVNGDFYWQNFSPGTHNITTNIPKERASVIQVYRQNTEFTCKTIQLVNPECEEECTFTFSISSTSCPTSGMTLANVLTAPSHSSWIASVYETSTSSTERFVSRVGNLVQFTPMMDGVEHNYILTLKEVDEGVPTGCEFSRAFSLTCGTVAQDCPMLDIVFCLDVSGSIPVSSHDTYRSGVRQILASLKESVDNGKVKVGIVTFGSTATTVRNLSSDFAQLDNDLATLVFPAGARTAACPGLNMSNNIIRGFLSRACNKRILFITDGIPSDMCVGSSLDQNVRNQELLDKATQIKSTPHLLIYNVDITTVGVQSSGPINWTLLTNMASTPSDTFSGSSFNEFLAISESISGNLCQNYGSDPAEPTLD